MGRAKGGARKWAASIPVSRLTLVSLAALSGVGLPEAAAATQADPLSVYARKGSVELGGAIGLNWTEYSFAAKIGPQLGYFMQENLELSMNATLVYESDKNQAGGRDVRRRGDVLLEPSYHFPLSPGRWLLAGLGVGVGFDRNNVDFEIGPHLGVNIQIGKNAVLTPAISVPFLFRGGEVVVGTNFLVGVSAAW